MIREHVLSFVGLLLVGASCVQSVPCDWTLQGCPENAFCEPERGVCVYSGDVPFRCDGGALLSSPSPEQASVFGESVALYGDHLLVAAPLWKREDAASPPQFVTSGATYVYQRAGESWSKVTDLVLSEVMDDRFGTSVALRRGVSAIAPGNRAGSEPAVVPLTPSPSNQLARESLFNFPRLPIHDGVKGTDLVALSDWNHAVILAQSNTIRVDALVYEGGFAADLLPRATSVPLPGAGTTPWSQILGIAADGPWLFVGLEYKGGINRNVWCFRFEDSAYKPKDCWSTNAQGVLNADAVTSWGEAGPKAIALSGGTLALSAEQPKDAAAFSPPRVFQLQSDGVVWAQEEVRVPVPDNLSKYCQGTSTHKTLKALAISGDLLAASWDECDAVVLFRRSTRGHWDHATLLADPEVRAAADSGSPNRFGSALAVSQHRIVVGAANSFSADKRIRSGAAYVYSCD